MEDEFQLRAYIEKLLPYWPWIVGATLLTAVIALVLSLLQPPTYEASAVVLVAEPRYEIQFDPRFETGDRKLDFKAFPTLATSDGILQAVVDAYTPSPEAGIDEWTLTALEGMVSASSQGDANLPRLVLLTAHAQSPQDAAAIANTWADVLTQKSNDIYSLGEADVAFFEGEVAQAERALNRTETALIDFQARSEGSIVGAELGSVRTDQANYLDALRTIAYVGQDIQGLRDKLAQQSSNPSISLADKLTALLLQIKAFNAQAETPIQLQVGDIEAISNDSQSEQIAFLDGLMTTLDTRSDEIEARLAELRPQILALQQRLQEITVESDHLTRAHELARETYLTLARKLEEARIAAREQNGILQVGSYAAVPGKPVSRGILRKTALAGIAGGLLAVGVVFFVKYWQGSGADVQGEKD